MGLQNQMNDVSTESFPILILLLIANGVGYLRFILFTILHSIGLSCDDSIQVVGSGLAVLAEQLNLNKMFSYSYNTKTRIDGEGAGGLDCVVCLSRLKNGDYVRRLACRHVFHKECFDGWLDHLNFNCPLCRSSLVSGEQRVGVRSGA